MLLVSMREPNLFDHKFWELTIRNASAQSQKRFIQMFDEYLEGVVRQAIDRTGHRIRDINSFLDLRRETIGTKPSFPLIELGLDIPDNVFSHPAIQEMVSTSVDMISIENVSNIRRQIVPHRDLHDSIEGRHIVQCRAVPWGREPQPDNNCYERSWHRCERCDVVGAGFAH